MLIPINYHNRHYPSHIHPEIEELTGHMDKEEISVNQKFSLHTEYSYGKRKLNSKLISNFPVLQTANKNGVPQLWFSERWAIEFAIFIKTLCSENEPTIIEVHPPFSDYTESVDNFISIYKTFEELILEYYPKTKIVIENRFGSLYRGGKFLISSGEDFQLLCDSIEQNEINLRIALDIPQIFSPHGGPQKLQHSELLRILEQQNPIGPMTESIHLWGKRKSKSGRVVSHVGDLNSYFEEQSKKEIFLSWFYDFLNDGKYRYFVPEVNNSDDDLHSIIKDLESVNIKFK